MSTLSILALAALFASPLIAAAAEPAAPSKLDPKIAREIQQILRETPLLDGHNDLPWQFRKRGGDLNAIDLRINNNQLRPAVATDIPRLRAGGIGAQFWSVYVASEEPGPQAVKAVLEQIDIVHQMIGRYPDTFELALTAADIRRIHHSGKIASLIGMEGGHSIDNSLSVLRMTYALGARYMTLTHTRNLDWADTASEAPKCHGLTPFGEQVVHEMNRLGMLVDLSHVSDETMRAALKVSKAPVIFSHSSARAVCNHVRNVPDDVLKLTAANGGVAMVCFMPGFTSEPERADLALRDNEEKRLKALHPNDDASVEAGLAEWRKSHPTPPRAKLTDVADHIDHIRKVAGVDHIGIGSDFDGFRGGIDGLEDVSCYPALLAELLRRGYTKEELKKIAGDNLLRVFSQAEKVAKDMR